MKKLIIFFLSLCLFFSLTVICFAEGEETPTMAKSFLDYIVENRNTILDGVILAITAILAWSYKKGLIPAIAKNLKGVTNAVSEGLSAANGTVAAMKESTDENVKALADKVAPALEKAVEALGAAEEMTEKMTALEAKLAETEVDRDKMVAVLSAEAEMFNILISACDAPQYVKDKAAETFTRVQGVLKAGDAE